MAWKRGSGTSRSTRRRRWWQLRQRWRMLGVFEIDQDHEFYHLTAVIKEGMQASIQTSAAAPDQEVLTDEHFGAADTQTHTGFEMQTFAVPVFAKVRRWLDISEDEYLKSLCSSGHYLQFISNSKSKADFFVTNDKRFFLKTQSQHEIRFLLSNLHRYMEHLEKYPHSLLVRFLGVHRIVIPSQMKKYFIVMQSVFFPDERINIRYDIKGCEVGRWTDPSTHGKQVIKVLKDNNFEGQFISLGQQKSWFVEQVQKDVDFLRSLNVLDYSLLLGHQHLHRDEQQGKHSLASFIIRAAKSVDLHDNPKESDPHAIPLMAAGTGQMMPKSTVCGSGHVQATAEGEGIPLQEIRGPAKETRSNSELLEFHEHHRRLLPNFKNAIHVIDGPDNRYFVGIIDIFTVYGWKKKLEKVWKSICYPGREFSTVSPRRYSERFCQWIQKHTQ
ncbi:phosphatidylinositol 4-phosphate 5-kinase-like protein 1 [Thalassophryne amazonica]|uniref:phosphatidylinositol 4-phosphate 5-kinase-like protein 1 n=1 Tax=Thalassophryne amazonica TaxID=390379 RepID=UPI001471EAD0|nr:phosphatidylinositol 4-phosphate 5-kinase-like protein 1 [Thalassophryne amazonica]